MMHELTIFEGSVFRLENLLVQFLRDEPLFVRNCERHSFWKRLCVESVELINVNANQEQVVSIFKCFQQQLQIVDVDIVIRKQFVEYSHKCSFLDFTVWFFENVNSNKSFDEMLIWEIEEDLQ